MALKKFRPLTPSQRFKIATDNSDITTSTPEKSLLTSVKNSGGRDNTGKMTIRNIGGGHKKQYRIIDFKRNKDGIEGTVVSIEYDPNRTAFIALLQYADGEKRYIIAPQGLQVGAKVISGNEVAPEIGNALQMKNIPLGDYYLKIAYGKEFRKLTQDNQCIVKFLRDAVYEKGEQNLAFRKTRKGTRTVGDKEYANYDISYFELSLNLEFAKGSGKGNSFSSKKISENDFNQ